MSTQISQAEKDGDFLDNIKTELEEGNFLNIAILAIDAGINEYTEIGGMDEVINALKEASKILKRL